MIVIGHKDIAYENIYNITNIDDIRNTPANSIVTHNYDITMIKYAQVNNIRNAIKVKNITQAIFCNALEVDYILVEENISKVIQNIAQNYMFDTKILEIISKEDDIENVAIKEIDGCIYESILKE
jgi:hypothetical protein